MIWLRALCVLIGLVSMPTSGFASRVPFFVDNELIRAIEEKRETIFDALSRWLVDGAIA